jgi:hypothetical protein
MVSRLIDDFTSNTTATSETETDIQARMPRRIAYLRQIKKQLLKLSRLSPFNAVTTRQPGVAGINAVSGSPHYERSHRLGVRLLREGISHLAEDEQHYLAPTWHVYEAWCFVSLAQQLEQQLPDFQWKLKTKVTSADMILHGQNENAQIKLYSQLICPSLEITNRYGYCSTSRERRPDLVLEYSDGNGTRFICLDSKYTTSRGGILDSMASAHIYRDAIKQQNASPLCSLLLVPKNPHLALLSSKDYIGRHGVGCLPMANNSHTMNVVKTLLKHMTIH